MNYSERIAKIKGLREEAYAKNEEANNLAKGIEELFIEDAQRLIKEKFGFESNLDSSTDYTTPDGPAEEIYLMIRAKDTPVPEGFASFAMELENEFSRIAEEPVMGYSTLYISFNGENIGQNLRIEFANKLYEEEKKKRGS